VTTDRGGNATAGVPLPRETPFVTAEAALDAGERVYADAKNRRWRADSARANAISITSRPIGSRRAGSDQGQSAARDKRPTAAEPGRKKTNQEQVAVRQRPKERVARNQYGVPGNKSL